MKYLRLIMMLLLFACAITWVLDASYWIFPLHWGLDKLVPGYSRVQYVLVKRKYVRVLSDYLAMENDRTFRAFYVSARLDRLYHSMGMFYELMIG